MRLVAFLVLVLLVEFVTAPGELALANDEIAYRPNSTRSTIGPTRWSVVGQLRIIAQQLEVIKEYQGRLIQEVQVVGSNVKPPLPVWMMAALLLLEFTKVLGTRVGAEARAANDRTDAARAETATAKEEAAAAKEQGDVAKEEAAAAKEEAAAAKGQGDVAKEEAAIAKEEAYASKGEVTLANYQMVELWENMDVERQALRNELEESKKQLTAALKVLDATKRANMPSSS
ncbi:hypothetical protein DV738_g1925, partial [Chaetothyriales sp. CBS 135597]